MAPVWIRKARAAVTVRSETLSASTTAAFVAVGLIRRYSLACWRAPFRFGDLPGKHWPFKLKPDNGFATKFGEKIREGLGRCICARPGGLRQGLARSEERAHARQLARPRASTDWRAYDSSGLPNRCATRGALGLRTHCAVHCAVRAVQCSVPM